MSLRINQPIDVALQNLEGSGKNKALLCISGVIVSLICCPCVTFSAIFQAADPQSRAVNQNAKRAVLAMRKDLLDLRVNENEYSSKQAAETVITRQVEGVIRVTKDVSSKMAGWYISNMSVMESTGLLTEQETSAFAAKFAREFKLRMLTSIGDSLQNAGAESSHISLFNEAIREITLSAAQPPVVSTEKVRDLTAH